MKISKKVSLLLSFFLFSSILPHPNVYAESITEVEGEIKESEEELESVVNTILELEEEIKNKNEELDIQEKQLENLVMYKDRQKENMKLRIAFMYENDLSLMSILLSSTSFSDFLNKTALTMEMYEYDRRIMEDYSTTMDNVNQLQKDIQISINELDAKKMELNAKRERIEKDIEANKELLEKLREEERRREEEAERIRRREEEEREAQFKVDTSLLPTIDSSNGKRLLGTWYITGYTTVAEENGGYAGIDCKGRPLVPWYTVACTALPLGTKVEIEGVGKFEVRDTGVVGEHIDVCVNNQAEAYSITGHRKVWVLN